MNAKGPTPRHIILEMPKIKDKERILKAAKERHSYLGVLKRLSADFSKETLLARRGWKEVLEVMKGKDQDDSIQQSFHLEWMGRSSASQIRSS